MNWNDRPGCQVSAHISLFKTEITSARTGASRHHRALRHYRFVHTQGSCSKSSLSHWSKSTRVKSDARCESFPVKLPFNLALPTTLPMVVVKLGRPTLAVFLAFGIRRCGNGGIEAHNGASNNKTKAVPDNSSRLSIASWQTVRRHDRTWHGRFAGGKISRDTSVWRYWGSCGSRASVMQAETMT